MKKLFLFLIFLFCISFTLADTRTFDVLSLDCVGIAKVDVTGNARIDIGEYSLINCSEIKNNSWECDCNNSELDLIMEVMVNTINLFSFDIEYKYMGEEKKISHSSGGGYTYYRKSIENKSTVATDKVEKKKVIEPEAKDDIVEPEPVDIVEPVDTPKKLPVVNPEPEKKSSFKTYFSVFLMLTAILLISLAIFRWKKKNLELD